MTFDTRDDATFFLRQYVAAVFPNGRTGYLQEGDYWWAWNETPAIALHCYKIES